MNPVMTEALIQLLCEESENAPTAQDFMESGLRPGQDMGRLWDLLMTAFAGLDRSHAGDCIRILDLGCGACEEAVTVSAFARYLQRSTCPAVSFTGVDVRERQIGQAKRRCDRLSTFFGGYGPGEGFNYTFLCADASRLSLCGDQIPEAVHLVFLRHQNTWNGAELWTAIFDQALERLAPDGWLVVTSYYDVEHRAAIALLTGLGAECCITLDNPYTRPLDGHGKSIDRHMAVFRYK